MLVLALFGTKLVLSISDSQAKAFRDDRIVPDVIDIVPPGQLKITYANGAKVLYGNELTPKMTKQLPEIKYSGKSPLYTLALVDPDVPSRLTPVLRELLHYLVINIPGNRVDKGDVLADYISPVPPMLSGLHRYTFLLYEQDEGPIKSDIKIPKNSTKGRTNFSMRKFAKDHKLGQPVAANFFEAQFDDSVPKTTQEQNQA